MAEIYPILLETELRGVSSQAEVKAYRSFRDETRDSLLVLFSVPFVYSGSDGARADGEADFVVFDPRGGILVVEVKGGGVSLDPQTGKWSSVDRDRRKHIIKDPFKQATTQKNQILNSLKAHPGWRSAGCGWIPVGHAVLFPDLEHVDSLVSLQRPKEILGGKKELDRLDAWLDRVFSFWAKGCSGKLGQAGISIARNLFCKTIEVKPLLATQIAGEEEIRVRLTEEQSRLLRGLGLRKRAAIAGGAGTGKTLLALSKAQQLADAGLNTVLVCYNRPLSDHLKRIIGSRDNLGAATFHQLCDWRSRIVAATVGRDLIAEAKVDYPTADHYRTLMPYALGLASEVLEPFDAIVVDEGQDFDDDYWVSLELSLNEEGLFYAFYDPNQAVYDASVSIPVDDSPFLLTRNCRNTKAIHQAAYLHYKGETVDPPEIEGAPVRFLQAETPEEQARIVHGLVTTLIREEGIQPVDIVVLLTAAERRSELADLLCGKKLPNQAGYVDGAHGLEDVVLVETVRRFKGLESPIVVLWTDLVGTSIQYDQTLYVGFSRAKARLFVVGPGEVVSRLPEIELA